MGLTARLLMSGAILWLSSPSISKCSSDLGVTNTIRYDGDVNIGVLVDLHHPSKDGSPGACCGPINTQAVHQVIAAKWAVEIINNQTSKDDLKIGLQLHDTCGSVRLTQRHLFQIISTTRKASLSLASRVQGFATLDPEAGTEGHLKPPLLGVLGIGRPATLTETTGALHAFRIPLMSVTGVDQAPVPKSDVYDNVLFTAPDIASQAKALVNVAVEMQVGRIALISANRKATRGFLAEASARGVKVQDVLEYDASDAPERPEDATTFAIRVVQFVAALDWPEPAVALITGDPSDIEAIADQLYLHSFLVRTYPLWLIATSGLGFDDRLALELAQVTGEKLGLQTWKQVFHAGVLLEPHLPELEEFVQYLTSVLKNDNHAMKSLLEEITRESPPDDPPGGSKDCPAGGGPPRTSDISDYSGGGYTMVPFIVKAVSALTAAFRLLQLDKCPRPSTPGFFRDACITQMGAKLQENVLENLKKLSFTSSSSSLKKGPPDPLGSRDAADFYFSQAGSLVAGKQVVHLIDYDLGKEPIGWYSEKTGLHLTVGNYSAQGIGGQDLGTSLDSSNDDNDDEGHVRVRGPGSSPPPARDRRVHHPIRKHPSDDEWTAITTSNNSISSSSKSSSKKPSAVPTGQQHHIPDAEHKLDQEHSKAAALGQTSKQRLVLSNKPDSSIDGDNEDLNIVSSSVVHKEAAGRTWTVVAMALAGLGASSAVWTLVFVLLKICDGTLGGHQQSLGLLLLGGIVLLYAGVTPWLLAPGEVTCAMRHFLHPLFMVLCYSVLLLKAMRLRSMIMVGLGGEVSQANQLLSLLFMLAVQVVITVEWYVSGAPPGLKKAGGPTSASALAPAPAPASCDVSRNRYLLIHTYPAVLLLLVACYAVSVVNVRKNFGEARWITGCSVALVPVQAVWLLICYFADASPNVVEAATSFGVITVASVLLCVIFLPKLRTIVSRSGGGGGAGEQKLRRVLLGRDRVVRGRRPGNQLQDLHRSVSNSTLFSSIVGLPTVASAGEGGGGVRQPASRMQARPQKRRIGSSFVGQDKNNSNNCLATNGTMSSSGQQVYHIPTTGTFGPRPDYRLGRSNPYGHAFRKAHHPSYEEWYNPTFSSRPVKDRSNGPESSPAAGYGKLAAGNIVRTASSARRDPVSGGRGPEASKAMLTSTGTNTGRRRSRSSSAGTTSGGSWTGASMRPKKASNGDESIGGAQQQQQQPMVVMPSSCYDFNVKESSAVILAPDTMTFDEEDDEDVGTGVIVWSNQYDAALIRH